MQHGIAYNFWFTCALTYNDNIKSLFTKIDGSKQCEKEKKQNKKNYIHYQNILSNNRTLTIDNNAN